MKNTFTSILAAAILFSACGGTTRPEETGGEQQAQNVTLKGLAFTPDELTVAPGTTVRWTNDDAGVLHTVTSGEAKTQAIPGVDEGQPGRPDGLFDSELQDAGATFEFTFDDAGTYNYFCNVHAAMRATIVVE